MTETVEARRRVAIRPTNVAAVDAAAPIPLATANADLAALRAIGCDVHVNPYSEAAGVERFALENLYRAA